MLTDILGLVPRKNHNILEIQKTGQLTVDDFKVQIILGINQNGSFLQFQSQEIQNILGNFR